MPEPVLVVVPPMEPTTDELATPPTEGHTLWALAREMDLVQSCPVCLTGALTGVEWDGGTPSRQRFSCGHSAPAKKAGRHRATD